MLNDKGIVAAVHMVVLLLLGIVLWLFWQVQSNNYLKLSERFEKQVVSVLSSSPSGTVLVTSNSKKDRRSGYSVWTQYEKTVSIYSDKIAGSLITELEKAAEIAGLDHKRTRTDDGVTFNAGKNGYDLSIVIFKFGHSAAKKPTADGQSGKHRIAIVIDDIGYTAKIEEYLQLGIPVTFAVLPFEKSTSPVVKILTAKKIPFILHMPMEPESYPKTDPGKAALFCDMGKLQVRKMLFECLDSVKGAKGVSNHMGSRFTANSRQMSYLVDAIKERNLFFFDSYTSTSTVCRALADAAGVRSLRNGLFLDLKDDPSFMRAQLEHAAKIALKKGSFCAIGHIQKKNMIPVLREMIPVLQAKGIEFVYLTELINEK